MEEGGIVPPHSVLAPGTALRLLPQQRPILRPGQLHCTKGRWSWSRTETTGGDDKPDSAGCSIRVAWQLEIPPRLGQLESDRGCGASARNHQARPHDALYGVALTARNSHQINPHLPLRGRAAHSYRERYLAKECVGSNRL